MSPSKHDRTQRTRDIHVLTTEDIKNITAIRVTLDQTLGTDEITQVIHAANSGGLSDGAFVSDEEKNWTSNATKVTTAILMAAVVGE